MARIGGIRAAMVAVVAGVSLLAPGSALASHSWGSYHWARTSNPFTLKVGDNVDSKWDAYLDEAIVDWSKSSVLDLTKVTGGTTARQCKMTTGRIEVCSARYGFNGWLGLAGIKVSGSHITAAYTKVNDSYFDSATYNTPAWRRLVMCQEIGHDFGLDHQDEAFDNGNLGSCMDYTNDPDGPPSNEHPNPHDYAQLETIYAHLDSTTTIQGAAPSAGTGRPDIGGEELGRLVSSSADGRILRYVLDLPGGEQLVSIVIRA